MDQNIEINPQIATMQNAKTNISTYHLDSIKLRLLQYPQKYRELSNAVNEYMKKRERSRSYTLFAYTYIIIGIGALIAYLKGHSNICFAIILLSTIMPFLSMGLYWLLDMVIPKPDDPDSFQIDGWTWVRLTDIDRENYERYLTACDEYDCISYPISWNDVSFKDGYVEATLKKRNTVIRYNCDSRSEYSTYKSALQNHFGQVEIEAQNGQYVIKDPSVIEESILIIIRQLELLEKERLARIDTIVNNNPEVLDARKNQQTIIITIKALKSDYLNHLLKNQAAGISIIKTSECRSYAQNINNTYERAYIFAVKNSRGQYCVIYENANDDNASIVATVDDEEQFYKCAVSMVNYMRSRAVNKRETLRRTHKIDVFSVKSINHDDIATWKSHVTGDYFVRVTDKHRYKYWRRRRKYM